MFGKIILYTVLDLDRKTNPVATVVPTKKDCDDYITRLTQIKNWEHYKSWCALRGYGEEDSHWPEYVRDVNPKTNYAISKKAYGKKDMAALVRLATGCIPLGCDFETEEERALFVLNFPEVMKEPSQDEDIPSEGDNEA